VVEELRKRRWTEEELGKRRKTNAIKVKMAARLRAETAMTLDWIARRLQMGCRHTVANCLKLLYWPLPEIAISSKAGTDTFLTPFRTFL
jgi:hypothetical protein